MTETKREEMIAALADAWGDSIDIKDLIRQQVYEYSEQLERWTDEQIEEEWKLVFGTNE